MKKLEDIPKKDLFEAPEGYFDRLPTIIQARVAETEKRPLLAPYFLRTIKFALPVLVIGVASFFYFRGPAEQSTETLIASIDSEQLIAYLDETDAETDADDLLESIPFTQEDADALHQQSLKIGISDSDLEDLSSEFEVDPF